MPQATAHTSGRCETFAFAGRTVGRMGYGAMQLAGPGVFGPPKDRAQAIAVLRVALELGVSHIDTSDFYGPHVTNQIIRDALHPYPADLTIVTKVGAVRDDRGAWLPAQAPADIERAVHDKQLTRLICEQASFSEIHVREQPDFQRSLTATEPVGHVPRLAAGS